MRLTKDIQRAADERARKEDYFCAAYYGWDEEKFYFIPMFADSQERTLGIFTYIVVKDGKARIHRGLNYGGLDGIRKRDFTKGRAIYREFERKYDNDDFANDEEREYISAIIQNQRPSYEMAVDRGTLYEYLEIADRFRMKLELVPEPHTMERNDGWEYYVKLVEFERNNYQIMNKTIPEAVRQIAERECCNSINYVGEYEGKQVYTISEVEEDGSKPPTGLPVLVLWDGKQTDIISGYLSLDILSHFDLE